jgi:hypothetical protein
MERETYAVIFLVLTEKLLYLHQASEYHQHLMLQKLQSFLSCIPWHGLTIVDASIKEDCAIISPLMLCGHVVYK